MKSFEPKYIFNMKGRLKFSKVLIINLCFVIDLIDSAVVNTILPPCEKLTLTKTERTYEEYHMEHQVTKQEAIASLRAINETFFNAALPLGCKAIPCNQSIMKYCLGPQFINDHCWCEQGHEEEGLPWVPHTCYVGDRITETSVGSCFVYNEIKECCCDRVLAKRWRFLSSSNQLMANFSTIWLPIISTTFFASVLLGI
ncbi:uncharacterized protein LOC119652779 isoform X1 [Hermetia illucens]|nr:uncharacterized protein LOC119652779 isoform X1 [Hermetia illucens]